MIERRTIRFDHELLAELELPCFEARGDSDGPHLCLLAGIHGGEYSSIAAVVRFMNALDTSEFSRTDHRCPDREHAVVPRAYGVRDAAGRQEPQPLLPGIAGRDASATCLRATSSTT